MNFTGTLVLGFDAVGCVSGLLSCYIKCQHFFGHSETILIIIGDFVKSCWLDAFSYASLWDQSLTLTFSFPEGCGKAV